MSTESRSPTPHVATDAERSSQMPRSPIEYTVTDPTVTAYDVFKAHERFGEIYDVKRKDSENFTVTFVNSIERDAVAATAIDDDESLRQFADPPDQQSPANILNALNDDCLMEIFKRSHTQELYTMAHVCRRFRSIAVQVFQSSDRKREISFEFWHTFLSLSVNVNFIRIFRPTSLIALGLVLGNKNVILQAMAAHCPDLTDLDISSSEIEPETIAVLRPFFPQLREITIPATDILSHCGAVAWQLEELRIVLCANPAMPIMQMPRLRKLVVRSGHADQVLFEFLARNSQVTHLEFKCCQFSWTRLCTLAECVPNIQQLAISFSSIQNYDGSRASSIFKCLAMFKVECCKQTKRYLDLLRGAPLKRLKLGFGENTKEVRSRSLIDSICRLTTISSLCLHLTWGVEKKFVDDVLIQITSSLSCLRELHIREGNFTFACIRDVLSNFNGIIKLNVSLQRDMKVNIDVAVLDDISAVIAVRPELHVKIHVSDASVTVPVDRLRPYAKWLAVDEYGTWDPFYYCVLDI